MPDVARIRRNTIGDALHRSAARERDRLALSFEGRTYLALDKAATRVAARLLELGLRGGERIAAYGRNSDAYFLLWLGAARAGLVHVPVNYALKGSELAYILKQSGAVAVVADAAERGADHGTLCGRW